MPRVFIIPAGIPQPNNEPCLRQYSALSLLLLFFLGLWFRFFFLFAFTFFSFARFRLLLLENFRLCRASFRRSHRLFLHRRNNGNQNGIGILLGPDPFRQCDILDMNGVADLEMADFNNNFCGIFVGKQMTSNSQRMCSSEPPSRLTPTGSPLVSTGTLTSSSLVREIRLKSMCTNLSETGSCCSSLTMTE